jgi:dephospho-CoA kinase
MELRETTIDRLRKRLDRDPTEEEIKAERDRKWRFALADMGISAECFLDEK